jgi:hypothetical protein
VTIGSWAGRVKVVDRTRADTVGALSALHEDVGEKGRVGRGRNAEGNLTAEARPASEKRTVKAQRPQSANQLGAANQPERGMLTRTAPAATSRG